MIIFGSKRYVRDARRIHACSTKGKPPSLRRPKHLFSSSYAVAKAYVVFVSGHLSDLFPPVRCPFGHGLQGYVEQKQT